MSQADHGLKLIGASLGSAASATIFGLARWYCNKHFHGRVYFEDWVLFVTVVRARDNAVVLGGGVLDTSIVACCSTDTTNRSCSGRERLSSPYLCVTAWDDTGSPSTPMNASTLVSTTFSGYGPPSWL